MAGRSSVGGGVLSPSASKANWRSRNWLKAGPEGTGSGDAA